MKCLQKREKIIDKEQKILYNVDNESKCRAFYEKWKDTVAFWLSATSGFFRVGKERKKRESKPQKTNGAEQRSVMAEQYIMTKKGYDEAVEKLKYLQTVKRQEIVERIAEARSHGDLS